jgi:hypothetical protein
MIIGARLDTRNTADVSAERACSRPDRKRRSALLGGPTLSVGWQDVAAGILESAPNAAAIAGGGEMNVVWSATSPETGRFCSAVMRTDFKDFEGRYTALRSLGEGYVEVEVSTDDSRQVSFGFRGDLAVVGQLGNPEEARSFLLVGDGSLPPHGKIDVPFMDQVGVFTGDFVMTLDRAWDVVREFVRTGFVGDIGEWYEL